MQWVVQYKRGVEVLRLFVVEWASSFNTAVFDFAAPLAWTVYLKIRPSRSMEQWFGPFPVDEEISKSGVTHRHHSLILP